jgi:butyrate response factor 1
LFFSLQNISSANVYSKAVGGPVLQTDLQRMTTITTADNNSKISSQRYKTELCRSYHETGLCKYGDKCQFAHGYHEIRSLNRHPKYKTMLCRTYHCTGYCKKYFQSFKSTKFFFFS